MKMSPLYQPAQMGSLALRNRLVMTAMGTKLCGRDGVPTPEYIAYITARAQGGVGLVVSEVCRVDGETGRANNQQIAIDSDDVIPAFRRLAEAVHGQGARMFLQLHHPGMLASPAVNGNQLPFTPSATPSLVNRQPLQVMSVEQIHRLVDRFAQAARRTKEAGLDGVELHMAHFYLLHTFVSPYFNQREDEYGGSFDNRMRIIREIVSAIRVECGADFPIMARISAEDFLDVGGLHLDESIKIAQALEKMGVDAVNVTASGRESGGRQSIEPISFPQGWKIYLATAIRRMVTIPVCAVGVVRDPARAEALIDEDKLDFVGMGRSFLADPEWVNKAAQGRDQEIRRCISCRRCIQQVSLGHKISCSVNPLCGHEHENSPRQNKGKGTVLVVGGGPAGMTAACQAAKRGFDVTLFEERHVLGGQVALANQVPGKEKMEWLIASLIFDCEKAGVKFHLGKPITQADIDARKPDAVIWATGSQSVRPGNVPGIDAEWVYTPSQILSGEIAPQEEHVAIIGSGMTGLETAEYLAMRGNHVTIYEMADQIAPGSDRVNVNDCLLALKAKGVVIQTGRRLTRLDHHRVYTTSVQTGECFELPVDRAVLSLGVKPMGVPTDICHRRLIAIGDACKNDRILEAVRSGYLAAEQL